MSEAAKLDLQEFARTAAEEFSGVGTVERISVTIGEDYWDRPVYRFSLLLDANRSKARLGLVRTRLIQKLTDELAARNDGHLPVIQLLSQDDWKRVAGA